MSITTTTRQASIDEIAAEMDRRGMVIEQLEARLAHIDGIDAGAIDNLHHHQRQLDADGIEVGVSRQALLEVLTGVEAALPALRAAPAGDVAEALNPDALAALKNGQRQLDQDGVEVGVSRQALDELIAAFEARTALSAQGWRDITEDDLPPHGIPVLLWSPPSPSDPNGSGLVEAVPFSTGTRGKDWSTISQHGYATKWMPLPSLPAAPTAQGGA